MLALYCVGEELENLMRTDCEQIDRQTDRQTENSITEATLIPMDCRGERANMETETTLIPSTNVWSCRAGQQYDKIFFYGLGEVDY